MCQQTNWRFVWSAVTHYTLTGLLKNSYNSNKHFCIYEPDCEKARLTLRNKFKFQVTEAMADEK